VLRQKSCQPQKKIKQNQVLTDYSGLSSVDWSISQHHASHRMSRVCTTALLDQIQKVHQVVKNMHGIVHGLKLRLARKKTFIGRISKGFGFLGCRFGELGLTGLEQQTIDNQKQKPLLLYEQNASDQRVGKYVIYF
jgi:hypothetical protein